jgi:hypothetical protein
LESRLVSFTRIAVERSASSVTAGALLNVEAVQAQTPFAFDLLLLGDAAGFAPQIRATVEEVSRDEALGALRSIGFGHFAVLRVQERPLGEWLLAAMNDLVLPADADRRLRLVFTTPFVLGDGQREWAASPAALTAVLQQAVVDTFSAVQPALDEPVTPLTIGQVEARLRPEFLGRFSLERGLRENRLVAWPGESWLDVRLADSLPDLRLQMALLSTFGLGEWQEIGFGRFTLHEC